MCVVNLTTMPADNNYVRFWHIALLRVSLFVLAAASAYESLPPTCPSDIYCHGPLLHTVQMASIYHDSKTFVDMKMKYGRNDTLKRFKDMMKETKYMPTRTDIESFVNDTFDPPGSEFESYEPVDWIQSPSFLEKIADSDLKEWASKLNVLWKFLGRKMKDEVRINEDHYSIIYVPNPVIVPGGRFREFYYWDSYWIIRGLVYSEMFNTIKGMLGNFLSIVETYGFIPNGGRIYYAMRSQPPLLIPMVKSYLDAYEDKEFLKNSITTLEKEFQFWISNHTVQVEKDGLTYTLARYKDASSGPRPESYREDMLNAHSFKNEKEKENFYSEIKSAAESGWDFSSRWFILNGTNQGNLTNLKTRSIIPVDLNAIIYWNAKILAEFYKELDMGEKHAEYLKIAEDWLEAVTKVLWHDEVGVWLDYDIYNEIKRDYFYPTNISPLWTGCYDVNNKDYFISKVMKYLEKTQIMNNLGGIPTTLEHSGEQWDYPNAWPPLQYIMIMGLDSTGDTLAQELAYELSVRWIRSNYKAFNESNAMYEKYDATVVGGHGGGGEYDIQLGFGWSNGVCMELLDKYGDKLTVEDKFSSLPAQTGASATGTAIQQASVSTIAQVLTALLALIATLAAGCIGMLVYKKKKHEYVAGTVDKRKPCPKLRGGYMELKDLAVD